MIGRSRIVRRESQIKAFLIRVVKIGDFSCLEFNEPKEIYFITHRYQLQNGYDQRVRVRFTYVGRK